MARPLTTDDLPKLAAILTKTVGDELLAPLLHPIVHRIAACEWWLNIRSWPAEFTGEYDPAGLYKEGQSCTYGYFTWVCNVPESKGATPGVCDNWIAVPKENLLPDGSPSGPLTKKLPD